MTMTNEMRMEELVPVMLPPEFPTPPKGWRWAKLTDLARLESGHTPSRARPDWWGGDISWLSLTEIRALDGQWVKSTEIRTNEAGIANSSARILPRGTVCFSRTASVGFVAIMAEPMATSQDFANWVCGDDLDPEFLMYALIRARDELRALATGATHKTIYMPMLGSFHLCLPDRATQGAIVQALKAQLAAAGEARQVAQAQLDDADQLIQSLLRDAFSRLREVALLKISEFAKTCSGTTPSRGRKDYWSPAKYPWVKTGEVAFEPILGAEELISDRALKECSLSVLPPKTVLVAMYGQGKTRGQSALLGVAATTNQACFAILPSERVDPEYLQFWLRRSYQTLRELSEARGGSQSNLNGEMMNAFEVPVPDLGRQKEIAAHLKTSIHAAQQLRYPIEQQLQDIKRLPGRLLAQAFYSNHPQ